MVSSWFKLRNIFIFSSSFINWQTVLTFGKKKRGKAPLKKSILQKEFLDIRTVNPDDLFFLIKRKALIAPQMMLKFYQFLFSSLGFS